MSIPASEPYLLVEITHGTGISYTGYTTRADLTAAIETWINNHIGGSGIPAAWANRLNFANNLQEVVEATYALFDHYDITGTDLKVFYGPSGAERYLYPHEEGLNLGAEYDYLVVETTVEDRAEGDAMRFTSDPAAPVWHEWEIYPVVITSNHIVTEYNNLEDAEAAKGATDVVRWGIYDRPNDGDPLDVIGHTDSEIEARDIVRALVPLVTGAPTVIAVNLNSL